MSDPKMISEDLIAFGFSGQSKPYYTVRDSLLNPDPNVVAECKECFGADFKTICEYAYQHLDLDRRFYPQGETEIESLEW